MASFEGPEGDAEEEEDEEVEAKPKPKGRTGAVAGTKTALKKMFGKFGGKGKQQDDANNA